MAMQEDARPNEPCPNLLATFLRTHLDAGEFSCLQWVDADRGIASLSWTHGGESEMPLFKAWRISKYGGIVSPPKMKKNFNMAINNGAGVRYLKKHEVENLLGLSDTEKMKYIKLDPMNVTPTRQEAIPPDSDGRYNSPQQGASTPSIVQVQTDFSPDSGFGSVPATVEAFSAEGSETHESALVPPTQQQSQPLIQPQSQPQDQPQSQPLIQPQSQPQDQPQSQPLIQPQSRPQDQPQSQPLIQPQNQPQDQSQSQPLFQPQSQPQDQPQSQLPSQQSPGQLQKSVGQSQPSDYDIIHSAFQLTVAETSPPPITCKSAKEPILTVVEHQQRQFSSQVPAPNFRHGANGTESWVNTLTSFDLPDLSNYEPTITITSSDDRMLKRLIDSTPGTSALTEAVEESLSSGLMSMNISDHSWNTASAERAADELRADGGVIDNSELLKQLKVSRLRDCVLPENIGDRGGEFVVVVRCEGRIECAQVVETSCRLVPDRKRSRGPKEIRQLLLCRRDHKELQDATRQTLEKCEGGILIECDKDGDVFVERRKCRVYWRKPYDAVAPLVLLKRKERTKIFDFNMYFNCLGQQSNPEVLLDIGNGEEDTQYSKLLVTVMSRKAHELYTNKNLQPVRNEEVMSVSDGGSSAMSCE